MPKGVFGLSTALSGLFSYPCLPPASPGFTFSADFLLREKVDIESVGLDAAAAAGACFSGERDSANVADGVLLCEEDEPEVFVEKERERRSVEPISATDDEMLCREACLLRGGVAGNLGGGSYRLGRSGWPSTVWDDDGVWEREGAVDGAVEELLDGAFCLDDVEKKEGRRLKMPARVAGVESCSSAIALEDPRPTFGRRARTSAGVCGQLCDRLETWGQCLRRVYAAGRRRGGTQRRAMEETSSRNEACRGVSRHSPGTRSRGQISEQRRPGQGERAILCRVGQKQRRATAATRMAPRVRLDAGTARSTQAADHRPPTTGHRPRGGPRRWLWATTPEW
jgi:hypothetical protein